MSSQTVEECLTRLEKELSRVRRRSRRLLAVVALAIVGLALAWALTSVAVPRTIRANKFILEDAQGRTRASLAVDKDGTGLALFDENGEVRAGLAVVKDGPMLALYDENGTSRAVLGVLKDGPGLGLVDENGNPFWQAP